MIVAINYANEVFKKAQKYNTKTARKYGKADVVYEYSPEDIDPEFARKNRAILAQRRGGGYWLWKPYFIHKTLYSMKDGDYLFYCDSGAFYQKPIRLLVDALERQHQDIMPFVADLECFQRIWTKRDAFILMDCDEEKYIVSPQLAGTFVLIRNTPFARDFYTEYLRFAQDERIITDSPSQLGSNYEGFIEHRHDQSVFSLLCYKYNLLLFRDPCQYGDVLLTQSTESPEAAAIIARSNYPQIITSTRRMPPYATRIWIVLNKVRITRYILQQLSKSKKVRNLGKRVLGIK